MSRLINLLKDYPNLSATLQELNDAEEREESTLECDESKPSTSHTPLYHAANLASDSSDGEEDNGDEGELPEDETPRGEEVEACPSEEYIDDDNYNVQFPADGSWVPMVEGTADGIQRIRLSAPDNLTESQYNQWVVTVETLMTLSRTFPLYDATITLTSDGVLIKGTSKTCKSHTRCTDRHMEESTSDVLLEKASDEDLEQDKCHDSSDSSLPSAIGTSQSHDSMQKIDKAFILRSSRAGVRDYTNTFSGLFGSKEAASIFIRNTSSDLKEVLIAGLKRKGIYNQIRNRYILEPFFDEK
ncbi:phosphoprotein [Mejal virus]|uniref:Phosphoprotein n=1 Tax=Mejal virus TaxID=2838395 RepID=A0A8E7DL99_9RHAB|nr:phosphoprotein [Mejal virus]QVU40008.1 phosphoprotein [Mejal virus]